MDEKEIGKNVSSGAEKVENIERQAEQERASAERRVEEARRRLHEQQERKERREAERIKADYEVASQRQSFASDGGNGSGKKGKKRGDGLGGWIAAVVSLGVVSLALTAVVTVGAIKMREERAETAAAYRGTVYEIIHIVEEVDDDLETLQISEDPAKQAEILTDILVQTRMAEADLEKLPFDSQSSSNTMRFLNGISEACERMLDKLGKGVNLNEKDKELLSAFYETEHKICEALDELAESMEDDDVMGLMKGKENRITQTMQNVENNAMPKLPNQKKNGGRGEMNPNPSASKMEERAGVSSKKAEEYCKKYFADYSIAEISYAGETLGKGLKAYNFEMRTENDVSMFAQISQNDGSLIYFDYYEECNTHLFDIESAKNTAIGFLEKLGYENMIPVAVDESGTNADFTFAYYADGCTYYPDEIVVKVCEQRGIVSGLDASKYLKNHTGRVELNAKITMQQAREKLSDKLTVESSRLVLFEHKGREVTAYEFFCAYGGQTYFVYLDANDGRELYIVNSKDM